MLTYKIFIFNIFVYYVKSISIRCSHTKPLQYHCSDLNPNQLTENNKGTYSSLIKQSLQLKDLKIFSIISTFLVSSLSNSSTIQYKKIFNCNNK